MKKPLLLGTLLIAALLLFWVIYQKKHSQDFLYYPIESKSNLSAIQRADPLPQYGKELHVKRLKKEGHWQIKLEEQSSTDSNPFEDLGVLSAELAPPDIIQGLYLCEFNEAKQENITLDTDASCSGGIKLHPSGPVGYSSKKIRPGHLAVFRCKSKSSGYYLSLNSRCESPDDSVIDSLGAFLTRDLAK